MNIQKVMILPVCLGILLVGIVMIPNTFAGDGCGPGTIMVNGVCKLDEKTESSSMSIEPLYVIIAVVAIGGVIGGVFAVRKGSKTAKPTQEEPKRIKTSVETKEVSESCQSCGTSLKPGARFCGNCGTPRS